MAFDALESLTCGIEVDVSDSGSKMRSVFFDRLSSRAVAPMGLFISGLVTDR